MIITTISFLLFSISLFLYTKKGRKNFTTSFIFFVVYFSSVIFYLFYFISDYFTGHGITDATVYTLRYGLAGAGFLEYNNLIIVVSLTIVFSLIIFFKIIFTKNSLNKKISYSFFSLVFLFISWTINPGTINLFEIFQEDQNYNVDIAQASGEEKESFTKTDFDNFYEEPSIKKIAKEKNLVFIYLEGLEQTYSDEKIFPDLTPGLNELGAKNIYFSNINQSTYGADYTIAGMVASQCGMPLTGASHGNSLAGMDTFLQGATCLGDLLHSQGYYLSYYGGASLDFAGKGKLYQTHSFDDVKGREDLLPSQSNPNYKNGWGLYDDSLLDLTYNRFEELAKIKDKFALFLLTLDTHHPNGQISKPCENIPYQDGKNAMLNAVHCSDMLVTNFVKKIQNSEYSKDVVIVLVSDHLGLRNTATPLLEETKRTNRFMVIESNNNIEQKIDTWGTTIDTGATVMSYLGFEGTLGLGRDLTVVDKNIDERIFIYSQIKNWKSQLESFFQFPKLSNNLSIDIEKEEVQVDNRTFRIPALIELDNSLQTTIKFQFYLANLEGDRKLTHIVANYDDAQSFILIDKCVNSQDVDDTLPIEGYCLVAGKKGHYVSFPVTNNMLLSKDDVSRLAGISG